MFTFTPWRRLTVKRDKRVDRIFLTGLGRAAAIRFMDAQLWPKSGRWYRRPGRWHRASARGEYPAKDTGNLRASEDFDVTSNSVIVGNTADYSKWLRDGTTKMARRKMSDNALSESTEGARSLLKGWVRWEVA